MPRERDLAGASVVPKEVKASELLSIGNRAVEDDLTVKHYDIAKGACDELEFQLLSVVPEVNGNSLACCFSRVSGEGHHAMDCATA